MARITSAGAFNWRAAFEGHPGLAVTPENYRLLTAPPEPEPAAPVPAAAPLRRLPPPARVPAGADGA
jgi:hypothetical protein